MQVSGIWEGGAAAADIGLPGIPMGGVGEGSGMRVGGKWEVGG